MYYSALNAGVCCLHQCLWILPRLGSEQPTQWFLEAWNLPHLSLFSLITVCTVPGNSADLAFNVWLSHMYKHMSFWEEMVDGFNVI